ncbi:ATP-binding protein [Streptomyces nanshensis]|uniref:ATP-binding protein n=2 Tax=Streptomyces nanshensis TaxID=518642 RepID=A0A1E7KP27_9ACTN|nr:ATP-binding protein [Streptomyces nanshensis]OEV05658.1 ATP-binding protein [Streptomyces nanshensis]
MPPMPRHAPGASTSLAEWLRVPRPEAEPGIWRYGHRPKLAQEPDRIDDRQLLGGALLALLVALLVWSLITNGYIPVLGWLYGLFPNSWAWGGESHSLLGKLLFNYCIYAVLLVPLFWVAGRAGRWPEVWRRHVRKRFRGGDETASARNASAAGSAAGPNSAPKNGETAAPADHALGPDDPAFWPGVRGAGEHAAADLLTAEVRAGRMNDVDYARIAMEWRAVEAQPERRQRFTAEVMSRAAAAFVHPSAARDLPSRVARHDLRTGQVRLGSVPDVERNPYRYRGTALALEPGLLSTSLLAVGPSGAGKTAKVVRPVVETLALQALAGRTALVAAGPAGSGLGPDSAFDVVIKLGHPDSAYDLDLYGGTTDPDEAAAVLAEALVGDDPQTDPRRAATALAQLIGPYRAAHGRFPPVPELRELLDGVPVALAALREACESSGSHVAGAALRELDARERQSSRADDPGRLLADRVALLDRPAFAGFFDTSGESRPFSMRALEHAVRVRIDLPDRGHAEASRLLSRLLLAQFSACVAARDDRSHFACLVLDDATHAITESAVREIQRLRSANAGVLLALRTLADVPENLRTALLGAVGCRVVMAGVNTWDGEVFAQAWGRDWVQTEDVTHTPDYHGGLVTRWVRGIRALFTGVRATTQSVTVRTVQRERWSASDLANDLPPGHAVLSLTTVRGERTPPILAELGE